MHFKVLYENDSRIYKPKIDLFLQKVFGFDIQVELSDEFLCAVVVLCSDEIIGCGFAYTRKMHQDNYYFKAGVLGGIAVSNEYRKSGICNRILNHLENELKSIEAKHSFLFAYKPEIYKTSGYVELEVPIYYFDKPQNQWNQFVYRGGMVKSFGENKLLPNIVVNFQGCIY